MLEKLKISCVLADGSYRISGDRKLIKELWNLQLMCHPSDDRFFLINSATDPVAYVCEAVINYIKQNEK